MVMLYIIGIQILYRFENRKEPISENEYLSQYVGLPTKISWFIKTGKDMNSPIGTKFTPVRQFCKEFAKNTSTNSTPKRFKGFYS